MKKIAFVFTLMLITLMASAQSGTHQYDYDAAGNRIARNVIYIRAVAPTNPVENQKFSQEGYIDTASAVSEKITENLTIDLFPNPTLKTVQIEFSDSEAQTNEVRLIGQNGKVLYQKKDVVGDFKLDLEAYPIGTYFIWLLLEDKVHRFQVVKQ